MTSRGQKETWAKVDAVSKGDTTRVRREPSCPVQRLVMRRNRSIKVGCLFPPEFNSGDIPGKNECDVEHYLNTASVK